MIRILFIGKGAPEWSGRIGMAAAGAVETDATKLPAAGIRRIDESPPDLVVVVAPESDARLGILLEGIRSRPVGGLAPLLLLSSLEPPADVQELYDLRIAHDTTDEKLLAAVQQLLELDAADLAPRRADSGEQLTASSLRIPAQAVVSDERPVAPVDDVAVERKLREVRHDNYFVILEVSLDALPHTIRDAFQTQARRFDARNVPPDVERRWDEALREIRDAIEDAWAVLGSQRLRERYARHHR